MATASLPNFCVGEQAEAVDVAGIWAPCKIKKVNELEDGNRSFYVSFDGWSQKWNVSVPSTKIRKKTVTEHTLKTASLRLEKDDAVSVKKGDTMKEGFVVEVDPIRSKVLVVVDGEDILVDASEIKDPQQCEPPSKKTKVSKVAMRKKPSGPKSSTLRQASGPSTSAAPEQQLEVNISTAANTFVGIGDVCSFANMFLVLVTSLSWTLSHVTAICKVCVIEGDQVKDFIVDSEVRCPVARLYVKPKVKLTALFSKRVKEFVRHGLEATTKCSLAHGDNYYYQRFLRQCRIGSYICHHVTQTLRGNAFRHVFDFVIHDVDFSLFGLTDVNNYNVLYTITDFSTLDMLFFKQWDVFHNDLDPTAHFTFVHSIRFKAESRRIVVVIQKAICNKGFSEAYRQLAQQYAASVTSSVLQE
ncbi:uncharacterized protein [Apostichopus japonicus]|uniref:uncharacterized protein isoform X1 n=1 Tax=Stichopus japonicus TaxID=307972 RepID=UPI003AB39A7A